MSCFIKMFKANKVQFLILQSLLIILTLILRVSVDIRMFSFVIGLVTSVLLLISLVAFEGYKVLPISFRNMFNALALWYILSSIVSLVGFLSYGYGNYMDGLFVFLSFHVFTMYCYFIYFGTFRTRGDNILESSMNKPDKETSLTDYIIGTLKLLLVFLIVVLLKHIISDASLVSISYRKVILVSLLISIVLKLKFILYPFLSTYRKLVNNDY